MLLRDGDLDKRRVAVEGEALRAPPRARPPVILGGTPARRFASTLGGEAEDGDISKMETSEGTAIAKGGCCFALPALAAAGLVENCQVASYIAVVNH